MKFPSSLFFDVRLTRSLVLAGPIALGFAVTAPLARAQVYTWQGSAAASTSSPVSGNFSAGASWSGGTAPSASNASNQLDFNTGSAAYTATDDVSGNFDANILGLGVGSGTVTATIAANAGSSLDFVASGTNPVVNEQNTGGVTISAPVILTNNLTLQYFTGDEGLFILKGAVSGSGSLIMTAPSTAYNVQLVSGSNSYSGGTTVSGSLSVQASGALGTGTVTMELGRLGLYTTTSETQANNFNFQASSILSAENGTTGGTASVTTQTVTGTISIASGVTASLETSGSALGTVSTAITGSGNLSKTLLGSQTVSIGWVLSGNNSYTGTTAITGGLLAINGTTSGQGSFSVTNSGNTTVGILGGNGTIGLSSGSTLSVNSNATAGNAILAPSSATPTVTTTTTGSIGTLSVAWAATNSSNKVTFGAYSTYSVDVGDSGSSDRLVVGSSTVTGALTLTGTTDTLALTSLSSGGFDGSTYIIARSFVPETGTFSILTVNGTTESSASSFAINGYNYAVDYNVADSGGYDIELVVVPEPATWIGSALLLILASVRVRRTILRARAGRAIPCV
jgi:autotransporter-associated beta strand protein